MTYNVRAQKNRRLESTEDVRKPAETMVAIIQERNGDPAEVLELRPIARPVPGAGEVLVGVLATYPLAEVAEAVRFVTDGHARGQVVVTVGEHKNERTQ